MGEKPDKYEILQDLMRRRGFAWGSFEIYGGSRGFYDYGPLGATIKRKIERKIRGLPEGRLLSLKRRT